MRKLLKSEKGVALIMVMAFTALSLPTVVGALRLASTLSLDSRAKTETLRSQYAALGGQPHGRYRVVYDTTYMAALALNTPTTETITLNGKTVTVTFVKTAEPPPPPVFGAEIGREILVQKTLSPGTASASVETTFTYTITMSNFGPSDITLSAIYDQLPGGYAYVAGSTSGSLEPSETIYCLFGSVLLPMLQPMVVSAATSGAMAT